jgi:hypothetical protein
MRFYACRSTLTICHCANCTRVILKGDRCHVRADGVVCCTALCAEELGDALVEGAVQFATHQ